MPRYRVTYHQRKRNNVTEIEGETILEATARLGLPKCRWDVTQQGGYSGGQALEAGTPT